MNEHELLNNIHNLIGEYLSEVPEPELKPVIPEGYEPAPKGEIIQADWKERQKGEYTLATYCIGETAKHEWFIRPIKPVWNPEWYYQGNEDFWLTVHGEVEPNISATDSIGERGRMFSTAEKAMAYSEWERKNAGRLRALQVLESKIAKLNEGWMPDWGDKKQDKGYILKNEYGDMQYGDVDNNRQKYANSLYLKSETIFNKVIEELGEDLVKQALQFE